MRPVEVLVMDSRLRLSERAVRDCLSAIENAASYPAPPGSLEVAFVDEAECSRLHEAFFQDPDITDVMTFPGDPEDSHAGDIAICPSVASTACTGSGLPFNEELTLYLVHAWLHLAGLEDTSAEGVAGMRQAEAFLMDLLKKSNRILDAKWKT